jgi:hypothetical protein
LALTLGNVKPGSKFKSSHEMQDKTTHTSEQQNQVEKESNASAPTNERLTCQTSLPRKTPTITLTAYVLESMIASGD